MGSLDSEAASVTLGLAGARRFAEELAGWGDREDAAELAAFNAPCIEKFGNGGGNFRRLYAGFLEWAHELYPALVPSELAGLAWRSADLWTGIAQQLWSVADGASPWEDAAKQAREIGELEQELFERLDRSLSAAS